MIEEFAMKLSVATTKARSRFLSSESKTQEKNGFSTLMNSGFGVTESHSDHESESQFRHYRERFWSAARPIISRIASQPMLAGRYIGSDEDKSQFRTIGELVKDGAMVNPPQWIGGVDDVEYLPRHPFLDAWRNPNKTITSYNMVESVVACMLVTGIGYIVALEDKENNRYELYPIPPTWMTRKGKNGWVVKPPMSNRAGIEVDDSNVCGIYFADPENPSKCIAPMSMLGKSVMTDEAISTSQYQEFVQGGMPKVALIAGDVMNETSFTDTTNGVSSARPVRLEPEQRNQIVTWFQQQFAGARKAGRPIVLDAVIRDLKVLSRSPLEMGFMESSGMKKEDIYEGLGTPGVLNGRFEGVTRASGALAEQFFTINTLNPVIAMLSQALTLKFGPLFSSEGEKLCFWIAPATSNDPENELEWARLLTRAYAIERNELRRISPFNLKNREGMDDVMIPQTMEERLPEEDTPGVGRDRE